MIDYCTYFDRRYLTRALALYGSLRSTMSEPFRLWCLCLDRQAAEALDSVGLSNVRIVTLEQLESRYPELRDVKPTRSLIEYYFTLTPVLTRMVLDSSEVESVTYLDSDMFFYSDPRPLFNELSDGSVAIIGHRFAPDLRHLEKWGLYNVSWVTFRDDARGRKVLESWRAQCLEWCYDRLDGDRFADQKYLDEWPKIHEGIVILEHTGAGIAPWNLSSTSLGWRNGEPFVEGYPVIFYHFHQLRRLSKHLWKLGLREYRVPRSVETLRLYRTYVDTLLALERKLKETTEWVNESQTVRDSVKLSPRKALYILDSIVGRDLIRCSRPTVASMRRAESILRS